MAATKNTANQQMMVSFRAPEDVVAGVKAVAKSNDRTISEQYRISLETGLAFEHLVREFQEAMAVETDMPWGKQQVKPPYEKALELVAQRVRDSLA